MKQRIDIVKESGRPLPTHLQTNPLREAMTLCATCRRYRPGDVNHCPQAEGLAELFNGYGIRVMVTQCGVYSGPLGEAQEHRMPDVPAAALCFASDMEAKVAREGSTATTPLIEEQVHDGDDGDGEASAMTTDQIKAQIKTRLVEVGAQTRDQLAEFVGVSQESINPILGSLTREGKVHKDDGGNPPLYAI